MSCLMILKKEDFLKVIQEFPQDYYKYCEIKDLLALGAKKESHIFSTNLRCKSCSSL
jgi:hypothetical protein